MRKTIAQLEQKIESMDKGYNGLVTRNTVLGDENRILQNEIKSLREILKIYQGMSSLTIACERISDALSQTIIEVRRRIL